MCEGKNHDNGPHRPYIKAATLNGQPFNKAFLTHSQLTAGGNLTLEMDLMLNSLRVIGEGDRPPAPLSSLRSK